MLNSSMVSTAASNDAELVRAALAGEREAFGRIVARYQALICSVTYSATGNLGHSEDLAQETFVTAWKQLGHLREPEKLRSWLCGIARNLIHSSLRKQQREPSHAAESIDAASESHSLEPQPVEHTISHEEQAILWRSLEKIPKTYREPLVLFYRENQSVETVAERLELTPDAVHQRLSRGRKLLAEEVAAFVEGALVRTNPGQAFTIGVLAALPAMGFSAKAATLGAAAKGGAVVKGSLLGFWLGPALGLLCGYLGFREGFKNARTPRERSLVVRFTVIMLTAGALFFITCSLLGGWVAPRLWDHHPVLVLALALGSVLAWCVFVTAFGRRHGRKLMEIREDESRLHPESISADPLARGWEYRSRATLLGLPLMHVCWRGNNPFMRTGKKVKPAVGWIAIGEVAYGILYASGGVAVGGIAVGGLSFGVLSFGGMGFGLLAFGGLAVGGVALGGAAVGVIASGGVALAWHAALGGIVAARELACGGAALAPHMNDDVAYSFYRRHPWLNFMEPGSLPLFWGLCFGPMMIQFFLWNLFRRKMQKSAAKD